MINYLKKYWIFFFFRNIHAYIYMAWRFKRISLQGFTLYKDKLNDKNSIFLPYPSLYQTDINQLRNLSNGYTSHLASKYLSDVINLDEIDCVLDCGAFVGGFAIYAALNQVSRVIAFEPTERSIECCKLNAALFAQTHVTFCHHALGSFNGEVELNESSTQTDNSIGDPDQLATGQTLRVDIKTLATVLNNESLNMQRTLLKLEAEGYEVNVLKGLEEYRPRFISVDITEGALMNGALETLLAQKQYNLIHVTARVHIYEHDCAGNTQ